MGILVPDEVRALVESGALFVVNHSGGKDSQCMMIELLKAVPRAQMVVVHASLGDMEWPGALELAQKQSAAAGLPFIVARAAKTFLSMVERRFESRPEVPSWPSPSTRQCTSDLKRGPIQREVRRYCKDHGFTTVVNCMGMRAQESVARSKRKAFQYVESASSSVRRWFEWLPIHDYKVEKVFGIICQDGQEPHPAYAEGNDRLSCVFCIMASKNDLRVGAHHHPELAKRYIELEERTGYTMHASRIPLAQLIESESVVESKQPDFFIGECA